MLRAWNAENINQLGPAQKDRQGGSKGRKALGDTGLGSENVVRRPGKGVLSSTNAGSGNKQRRPLGGTGTENPLPLGKGGGLGAESTKPKQQRRALGDISNAGKGLSAGGSANGAKASGKRVTPGPKFTIHSDSNGVARKGHGIAAQARLATREDDKAAARMDVHVDDVEMAMGRTGDEEEVLVRRRAEQRAAKANNPFRTVARRIDRTHDASTFGSSKGARVARAGTSIPRQNSQSPTRTAAASNASVQNAIDRLINDDLEDIMGMGSDEDQNNSLKFLDDELHLDSLTTAVDDLLSTPLSPLDDSFLTQEIDLNFV